MALLAFETDPMDRAGPRTLHGSIHDAAFVLFVLASSRPSFCSGAGCARTPAGAATPAARSRPR
jgi:hypothetical protein